MIPTLGLLSAMFLSHSVARNRKSMEYMFEDPVEKMLAVPHRLQKVNG